MVFQTINIANSRPQFPGNYSYQAWAMSVTVLVEAG